MAWENRPSPASCAATPSWFATASAERTRPSPELRDWRSVTARLLAALATSRGRWPLSAAATRPMKPRDAVTTALANAFSSRSVSLAKPSESTRVADDWAIASARRPVTSCSARRASTVSSDLARVVWAAMVCARAALCWRTSAASVRVRPLRIAVSIWRRIVASCFSDDAAAWSTAAGPCLLVFSIQPSTVWNAASNAAGRRPKLAPIAAACAVSSSA